MGLQVTKGGGDFELLPEGSYVGICIGITDVGWQNGMYGFKDCVRLTFVLPTKLDANGEPFTITTGDTKKSIDAKANLTKYCEALMGVSPPDKASDFNITAFINKGCQVQVKHKLSGNGKTYANIAALYPLGEGQALPESNHKAWVFNIDNPEQEAYSQIPEWIAKQINFNPNKDGEPNNTPPPFKTDEHIGFDEAESSPWG